MKATTCKSKRNARVTFAQIDKEHYLIQFRRMLEPHEEDENFPPSITTKRRMRETNIRITKESLLALIGCINKFNEITNEIS